MDPKTLSQEQLAENIANFNPAMPLERPPRTLMLNAQDFNTQIHDPESLVSKMYWAAHKFHFFLEVLVAYRASLELVQQQQFDIAWSEYLELKDEQLPVGGPSHASMTEGDPLMDEYNEPEDDKEGDADADADVLRVLKQQEIAMRHAMDEMGGDFANENFEGEEGLFLLDDEDRKKVAQIFNHTEAPSRWFNEEDMVRFGQVKDVLLQTIGNVSPEARIALALTGMALNFIQKDIIPALAAACVMGEKKGNKIDMESDGFKSKLVTALPKWGVQAAAMEAKIEGSEKALATIHRAAVKAMPDQAVSPQAKL